jgi:hypothetical protein
MFADKPLISVVMEMMKPSHSHSHSHSAKLRLPVLAATNGSERNRSGYLLPGSRNGAGVPSGAGMRKTSRIIDTIT